MIEGMPLVQEHAGLPDDVSDSVKEEQEAVKEKFKEGRGYWSDFWEAVLQMDHEYLDRYTDLSSQPWLEGVLDPKMKEFIYIAADVSTTHLYTQGLESHIENAMEYGATRDELLEVIELVSEQGYDTMVEGLPILVEEARKQGKLPE
jgi:alkylhydroperoxidase/carboxymuconolactone decarboxylase family protein YurZ